MINTTKKLAKVTLGNIPGLVRKVILSWLLAVTFEYLLLPASLRGLGNLDGLAQMSFLRTIAITCGFVLLLLLISQRKDTVKIERWGIVGAFAILAAATLYSSFTFAYLVACLLLLAILVVFGIRGWNSSPEAFIVPQKPHKAFLWITVILSAVFFSFVCAYTVCRVYDFATPTYDFGIFAQMFYNMKESGAAVTTLERSTLLSHFDVHVSPIYYLMLPFYWLVPVPATLQVLQAAVLTSAVIPLWKLTKHHGLSGLQQMLLCALLLVLPVYSGGTGFDLHENCFLTPLLLWLFYGIDKKNTTVIAIATVLTLMVKEDAAVYVAVIALWLIIKTLLQFRNLDKRNLITGVTMLAASLGWFFAVTSYLSRNGTGVMTYRYDNFIYDGSSSLTAVIKAVILNPMKAVYECTDVSKLQFIMYTLLPFCGLPLLTRRYERYLLLIPYILINLMSDYSYQHDIFFQYNFGSTAFLLYLTVINLSDIKCERLRALVLTAAVTIGAIFTAQTVLPDALPNIKLVITNHDHYRSIRNALSTIPDDASVTATTFYTTYLSQRETIYDLDYCSKKQLLESDYIALQMSADYLYERFASNEIDGFDRLVQILEANGYEVYTSIDNVLVIYCKQ